MKKINYHMDLNYLAFYNGDVDRFNSNGEIVIYGSIEEVQGTDDIRKVSDCSVELQEEYKKIVDKE